MEYGGFRGSLAAYPDKTSGFTEKAHQEARVENDETTPVYRHVSTRPALSVGQDQE